MSSRGDSPVGSILLVMLIIGGTIAFWFYSASQFLDRTVVKMQHRSSFPISCSIVGDRVEDVRKSVQIYFWNGKTRIDLQVFGPQKFQVHEIITLTGRSYAWRDDANTGTISSESILAYEIAHLPNPQGWLCYPWIPFETTTFTPPTSIQFN